MILAFPLDQYPAVGAICGEVVTIVAFIGEPN
jgi:hypothetical protein